LIRAWEIKIVDHVDQKESDVVFIWCAAVEINVFMGDSHF